MIKHKTGAFGGLNTKGNWMEGERSTQCQIEQAVRIQMT